MQVAGLNMASPTPTTQNSEASQSSSNKDFAGLLVSLMNESSQVSEKASTEKLNVELVDLEQEVELTELLQILEIDEVLELTDEQLVGLEIEDIMAVITEILSLPLNDFSKLLDHDTKEGLFGSNLKDIVVTAKFFELMGKAQQPSNEQVQLNELLKGLTNKLELLKENRNIYLQKTFTQVAAEFSPVGMADRQTERLSLPTKIESANGLFLFQQVSKPEQLVVNLNHSTKPISSSELIKQFETILSKSHFSNNGGAQKLMIKLTPEHLGSLRIELIQRDAGFVAKILTTTATAKDILESHLNGLKQAFSSQSLQVDKIEIAQAIAPQERFLNKDQQQQPQQQGQERQEYRESNQDVEDDGAFHSSFEEALLNMEV